MTTNLDLAKIVAAHVQMMGVALRSASVTSSLDQLNPPPELAISQSHRASYQRTDDAPERLTVYLDFDFRATNQQDIASPPSEMELHATYVLIYSLPADQSFDSSALHQFAWLNGTYNAWPYWRELVQSVTGRVGLGAITVSVFRPKVEQMPDEPKPEAAA